MSNEAREVVLPPSDSADGAADEAQVATERPSWGSIVLRLVFLIAIVVALALFWRPLSLLYHQSRGRMLLSQRQDQAALVPLRAALRTDVEDPRTLLLLARTHRRLGNLSRVSLLLNQAEALGGDEERIERERRLSLAQTGQLSEVEALLPDLLLNPGEDGPDICQAFVQGYFANLRSGDAVQLLDVWQDSYPDDPQVYFMRGYLMQSMEDPEQAIELYRQGLKLAPDEAAMRRRLAETLLQANQPQEAEAELLRCVDQTPRDPKVWLVLAQCAYKRGELPLASQRLTEALQLGPDDFEARRLKGQLDLAQGKVDEALQELEAAVALRPYDFLAREAMGRALRASGRPEEAQAQFDYVAQAEQANGRINRLLRESLEHPADAAIKYEIGTILMQFGPPEDAARWMQAVLQLQPGNTGAHRALADYYEARGDAANTAYHRQRATMDQLPP